MKGITNKNQAGVLDPRSKNVVVAGAGTIHEGEVEHLKQKIQELKTNYQSLELNKKQEEIRLKSTIVKLKSMHKENYKIYLSSIKGLKTKLQSASTDKKNKRNMLEFV